MTEFHYYPFGTTHNLSIGEISPWSDTHHHVLFHFDQEPIYDTSLGKLYDDFEPAWHIKYCKLLANSERSMIKKVICQERGMLDWYYFYHGFAALDWFRDAKYLADINQPRKVFASYNHITHGKRSYRMALTARLFQQNIDQHGDISFHGTVDQCLAELNSDQSELDAVDKHLVKACLHDCKFQPPLYLDTNSINGTFSARLGHAEYQLWQDSFWHLVNETVFYDDKIHLTEKIFKPIVALRPFILVSSAGSLQYLRQYGFQTFGNYIDESYDLEIDPVKRLDMISSEVARLCSLGTVALADMFTDMQSILNYNKQHFFNDFRRIITEEMIENFDHCIDIWNNGRVDGRQRPKLRDKKQIKLLLLR
jgi:hypothetical protein